MVQINQDPKENSNLVFLEKWIKLVYPLPYQDQFQVPQAKEVRFVLKNYSNQTNGKK